MKKTNFFKIVMTLVMAFVINGLSAQILTDYSEDNGTDMYQTIGTTFRLYVQPDPIYSPSWDASTNTDVGVNSVWTWTYPADLTGSPESGVEGPGQQNWVEFTNSDIGTYDVEVVEGNTLIGCTDGSSISQTINIVAAPSAGFTTSNATDYCGDQDAQPINISITENVPNALAAYGFAVREYVEEIDGTGAQIAEVSDNTSFVDFPLTNKVADGTEGFTAATPDFEYDFNSSALNVSNGNRTRYTYTLLEASDAGTGTDGIISAISQKSDEIDGLQAYTYTDNTVTFIVNPTPTTGPIYHIPNDSEL